MSKRSSKRNTDRWVAIAAALLGLLAWLWLGNRNEKNVTAPARASFSDEARSTVLTKPAVSVTPPEPPKTAVLSHQVASPPILAGAAEACPPRQPAHGESCHLEMGAILTCAYGDQDQPTVCYCGAQGAPNNWMCPPPTDETLTAAKCEPSMPKAGTSCAPHGQTCQYGTWPEDMTCTCSGSNVLSWSCGRREYALH
jgi:hypothetical protein